MCVAPLKGWIVGTNPSGKNKMMITSFAVDHLEHYVNGQWISVQEQDNPSDGLKSIVDQTGVSAICDKVVSEYITIPCGHCIECLKDRGQQWTNRCMLEYASAEQNCYFVSLTYRDENLPVTYYADPSTGEAFPAYTLDKKHVQDFLKRVRKYFFGSERGTLRYYIAGEYGPSTMRPHYHCIMFGLPLDDLVQSSNPQYYNSAVMAKLWPYGFHQISPLQPNMIAYTCHYVTGKLDPESYELYDLHNMQRPFNFQSCKPSIGRRWYDEHKDEVMELLSNPSYKISVAMEDKGYTFPPPKYFEYLLEKEGVDLEALKKFRREKSGDRLDLELSQTNLSYGELLEAKERSLLSKYSKMLRREDL